MHVAQLAGWLGESGREVYLFAPRESMLARSPRQSSRVDPIEFDSGFRLGDIFGARRLARIIKEKKIRFLSVHRTADLFLSVLAKKIAGENFKLIFSQHMHLGKKLDFFHRWEYRQIDHWITPLEMLAEQTMQNSVITKDKISVIPQGLEQERFVSNKYNRAEARNRLELPNDSVIAGLIGRFDPQKGQRTLIKALEELHFAGEKIHVLLVGEKTVGEHEGFLEELKALAAEKNLTDFVHFRSFQEEPELFYAAIDLFVLGSYSETYGLVTIEAMLSKLPIVATDAGGTREIITDGKTGLLYPPRDYQILAAKILKLREDWSTDRSLGQEAYRNALARFSHETERHKWNELIERLC